MSHMGQVKGFNCHIIMLQMNGRLLRSPVRFKNAISTRLVRAGVRVTGPIQNDSNVLVLAGLVLKAIQCSY